MDPPQHGEFRSILSQYFTPRSIRALEPEIAKITTEILDDVMDRGECDFVTEISSKVPVAVIAEMLGVPRKDWPTIFRWTNEVIGGGDPEFQRGKDANETFAQARLEMFQYFTDLVEESRKHPGSDVTSIVSNAKVNGEPLPALELLSYLFLLVVAGNETTRNATSGGLLAFIENPEQFRRLKSDPMLIKSAVEEIVRWTSPVIQFARTAVSDTVVRGQKIRAGESVCLFYPSASRDEDVFAEPFKFDIGRNPNPHLSFGIGEHFCLGANLARLELAVIFAELAKRLDHAELAGPVERLRSSFVGGVKHMPIRYKLKPAS
jgi:cytochrome P450